ncbi:MAG: ferritin-like domain-containing protein [Gammaproteobacteria bacterium]|nr:ferritin-like domain-containing protein [Gammaproteobacteria bacterium]
MTLLALHSQAQGALLECDPALKYALTTHLRQRWTRGELSRETQTPAHRITVPGQPRQLALVAPRELQRRSLHTPQGYAALMHSLCHIEFNAINLALDVLYRFRDFPAEFYTDWLQVAAEEAYHFSLLRDHLEGLGYNYGSFPAHNSLWELALITDSDPLLRMALVPRVQEAHGLDVTPALIEKFTKIGATQAVRILERILHDEVGHVAVGNRWFNFLCDGRGLNPLQTFQHVLQRYYRGTLRGPFELALRKQAGFSDAELDYFKQVG